MEHIIITTLFNWLLTAPLLWTPKDWIVAICEIVLGYMIISYFKRRVKNARISNIRNKKRKI